MFLRKAALDQAGLLGEDYFMYFEETDLCWRLKKAGWEVKAIATDPIKHVYGGSFGAKYDPKRLKMFLESLKIFVKKNYRGFNKNVMLLELFLFGRLSLIIKKFKKLMLIMFSLVATVLNEKRRVSMDGTRHDSVESNNLAEWLGGLLSQSVLPEEIIIVDGGSVDGTWEYLEQKSREVSLLRIFQKPGNISVGRNFAIQKASGENIVVTDAGCSYHPDWFKKISQTLNSSNGKFVATAFGPWFKKEDSFLTYLIAATTIPAPGEFVRGWLPSSRSVAFSKELWQKVGGYPEWLPICEDVVFDLKIEKLGIKPELAREPLVFWRPRTTLVGYFKQLFKYTKSDGHAGLWLHRQLIRYFNLFGDSCFNLLEFCK